MGLLWIPALLAAANSLLLCAEGSPWPMDWEHRFQTRVRLPSRKQIHRYEYEYDEFFQGFTPQLRTPQYWLDPGPKIGNPPTQVETSPDIESLWESEVEDIKKHSTAAYNVAPKGKTSQSSTKQGAASRYATDGQLSSKCASTEVEYGPSWNLDLKSNHVIFSVAITNKRDCCAEDLSGAEIRIGNIADWRENPSCGTVSSIGLGETYSFTCHGMEGQFVTIAIRGKNVSLTLCEVQVFGRPKNQSVDESWTISQMWQSQHHGAPNVAPKGTATQSSDHEVQAKGANDGSLVNNHPHCSHTQYDLEPWWNLDLNSRMRIFSIAITNRKECCGYRLNGVEIRIGFSKDDVRKNARCAILTSVDQGGTLAINCRGMEGRYVSVFIPRRREYLTLCEVQVFALPSDEPESVPGTEVPTQPPKSEQPKQERDLLKPEKEAKHLNAVPVPKIALQKASQSSTYGVSSPRNAIDNNLDNKAPETGCAVTEVQYEPWWTVSLESNYIISAVAITNRGDCCASDLDRAEIRVGYHDTDWRRNPICGTVSSIGLGKTQLFKCEGMGGKFVTIVIPDKNTSLSLCEVQVFGAKVDKPVSYCSWDEDFEPREKNHGAPNMAPQGLASQPSYGEYKYGKEARWAIDENLNSDYYGGSCTHTSEKWEPWWTVDLKSRMNVSSVVLTIRSDCCKQRFLGAEIRIGVSKDRANPRCAQIPSLLDPGDTFYFDCEGMEGRYVSIVIPKRQEWLHICEVQVFAKSTESQSEHREVKPKDEDGNKVSKVSKPNVETVFAKEIILSKISLSSTKNNTEVKPPQDPTKCAITEEEYEPWWRADLRKTYKIHSVALTNRGASDLSGAEIRVGHNDSDWRNSSICSVVSSIGFGETNLFTCNLLKGKFITVVIPDKTASLALCEVQAFVQEAGASDDGSGSVGDDESQQPSHGAVNVAPRGLCSQSSYYDHTRSAKIAVDGDKSASYYDRSCIHTHIDFGPWWRVDLLSKMRVFSVAITNRGDCCGSRLNGAEILIGDSEERGGVKNPMCAKIVSIPNGQTFIYDCNGMEGRFVTIVIPKKKENLNFCEVQVFAEQVEERREEMFRNVALNGTASQSSTFSSSGEAGNANDGSLANNHIMGQCSITQRELSPWWMVDLESPYQIFSVVITNRVLECCKDRIIGAEIRIGSSEENGGVLNPRCGVITSMESGESVFFSCKGMVGRYVTVTIPGRTEHLILCEVQVFGLPETSNRKVISMDANLPEVPNGAPNVALKGASSQSSLYNNFGDSRNSIDGSLSSDYSKIQCSQTIWELRPWWTVDLKEVHVVFSVAVTNREDCCWKRINEAEIRIGDSREWGNNPRCAIIYSLGPGETAMFNCKGMKGKYVTVIIPDREEKLSLCEVQVFGLPSKESPPSGIIETVVTREGLSGKSLVFLEEGVQDYAILHPSVPIDLTQFTLCLRVSTELSGRREIILFSYHNDRDELNVWREVDGKLSLYLGSSELAAKFSLPGLSTFGTHICVTWESSSGLTAFWFDGKRSASKTYRKGHQVLPGGRVILGQDQDKFGSSFDAKQSFVGEISDVQLWNYVLPPQAIKEVYEGKSKSLGNIINWKTIKYTLYGNAIVK
ncbi:uncharacterized protein [Aquarana catesbeiana]|uniref:uncharacterized protein isoform X2 n=1 Tax=Aquarana catesbeiana TaxID=8400 RepID=UPI003CC9AD11